MVYETDTKNEFSLTPSSTMPPISIGDKVRLTTQYGVAELTVTSFGTGGLNKQAFFAGQSASLLRIFRGARRDAPVKVTLEILGAS